MNKSYKCNFVFVSFEGEGGEGGEGGRVTNIFLLFWNLFFFLFLIKKLIFNNYKTLKSSKQRAICDPYHIKHPNPYSTVTIVAKRFMSHVTGFVDLLLIKNSANNLKCFGRTNSLTNPLVRVLKSCKRPIRYLTYNTCLCEFTHKIICEKIIFSKVVGSRQIWSKLNSFIGTSLGKFELGLFNYNFIS